MAEMITISDCTLYVGDVLEVLATLPDESVQCCVTSPPYWGLRDYGTAGQLGLEKTPEEFIANMVAVFAEVRRVLRGDGTLWLNMGDTYAAAPCGSFNGGGFKDNSARNMAGVETSGRLDKLAGSGLKPKDLCGMPWRLALALQADGWWLRQDIIWHKPNPMPESVTDRCTKAHEYVFLLTKKARYFYDADAVRESVSPASTFSARPETPCPSGVGDSVNDGATKHGLGCGSRGSPLGRNARSVWQMSRDEWLQHCAATYDAARSGGDVWTITTQPYPEAHFATFPEALPERCIKAGTKVGDTVLDPFAGSGTTCAVAHKLGRASIGIELSKEYAKLAENRIGEAAHHLFAPNG